MTERDKADLAARLAGGMRQRGNGADDELQRALERMVGVGACRFGVTADAGPAGASDACALAPPIARMIDHTVLTPDTTEGRIRELCAEAREFCFASVCVNPCWVPLAAAEL